MSKRLPHCTGHRRHRPSCIWCRAAKMQMEALELTPAQKEAVAEAEARRSKGGSPR